MDTASLDVYSVAMTSVLQQVHGVGSMIFPGDAGHDGLADDEYRVLLVALSFGTPFRRSVLGSRLGCLVESTM